MFKNGQPRVNCGTLSRSVTVYLPMHEDEEFRRQANYRREALSSYILNMARKGRDDETPYYTHVGAMYSMISAMLMMFQKQR